MKIKINHIKKAALIILILIVLLVTTFFMVIYFRLFYRADIDGRHKGYCNGFTFTGPHTSSIMYALKSDKKEFNVDNVALDMYCGWFGQPRQLNPHSDTIGVGFYIAKHNAGKRIDPSTDYKNIENKYFIHEIARDEFWSEKYLASQSQYKGKLFSHDGDSVTIPKEAFSEQEGTLELFAETISFKDKMYYFESYARYYSFYINYKFIDSDTIQLLK